MNIPNYLTAARIALIPFLLLFFYLPVSWNHIACALIFFFAAFTDYLDGYLARRLGQESPLGEFLDPVADKLMVAMACVLIVSEDLMPYLAIPAAIIVGREIAISALREWMAEIGKRASVAVNYVGKIKTLLQMAALIALLLYKPGDAGWILTIGVSLFYAAAVLTLWSMGVYLKAAWPALRA